jgi:hypothetical protein
MQALLNIISASRRRTLDPLTLSPALWLDASDASTLYDATSGGNVVAPDGAVARWEDKSGNGRHFTQETLDLRPKRTANVQNGLDAIYFSSTRNLVRTGGTLDGTLLRHAIWITKTSRSSYVSLCEPSLTRYWDATAASGSSSAAGITIYERKVNGLDVGPTRQNLLTARGTAFVITSMAAESANANLGNVMINYGGGFVFDGYMPELMMFTAPISAADRQGLESYLNQKWAIY